MNDEINKIIQSISDFYKLDNALKYYLDRHKAQMLLDYITNLQQENERLSRTVTDYDETLGRVENEYEKLKEKNKMLQEDAWRNNANLMEMVKEELEKTDCEECEICEDYKSRIEKAVEYLKSKEDNLFMTFSDDMLDHDELIDKKIGTTLLNILEGKENE